MFGPMNPPPTIYTCTDCDAESDAWDDEPLGLCRYTGRGCDPGPCDCGASSDWTCDDCLDADPLCSGCGVTLTDAIDQDCGTCRSCGDDAEPPITALDVGIARAEAMGYGDRI